VKLPFGTIQDFVQIKDTFSTYNFEWCRDALKKDDKNIDALIQMAYFYKHGAGVQQDYNESIKWFLKVKELDPHNVQVTYQLAMLYMYCEEPASPENVLKALNLWKQNAEKKHVHSMFHLAKAYQLGKGDIEKDMKKAFDLFLQAAKKGHIRAQHDVGGCYRLGHGVEENPKESFKWYLKASEQGNHAATNIIGMFYEEGYGVEKDPTVAFAYHYDAANQGHPDALFNLALIYDYGKEPLEEADYVQAALLYKQAAEKGHDQAQTNLARMYEQGEGVEQNDELALKWYEEAARRGNHYAQHNLAICYINGEKGLNVDYDKAAELFAQAATHGNSRSQFCLGHLYEHGRGVDKSLDKAVEWYVKAAKQGDAGATARLNELFPESK
jgi:uncharacterized protein